MMKLSTIVVCVVGMCCSFNYARGEELHETWLNYMAGEWTFGTEDAVTGDCSYVPCGKAKALTLRAQATVPDSDFCITGVIGWHAEYKMFVETDFGNNDSRSRRTFTVVTDKALTGTAMAWGPNGGFTADIEYQRISDNEMHLRAYRGDKEFWKVVFKRKVKK
jgi:hypothetical protein